MLEFIVIFIGFALMITLMAVGVMFKRKPITGSCGGLSGAGIKKSCSCDKPCDNRIAREAEMAQLSELELKQQNPTTK